MPTPSVTSYQAYSDDWMSPGFRDGYTPSPDHPYNSGRDTYQGGTRPNPRDQAEKTNRMAFLEQKIQEIKGKQNDCYYKITQYESTISNGEYKLSTKREARAAKQQKKTQKEYYIAGREGDQIAVKRKIAEAERTPQGSYERMELGSLYAERMQIASDISNAQNEVWSLQTEIGYLDNEIYALEQEVATARTNLNQLNNEKQYYESDIREYQRELDSLRWA